MISNRKISTIYCYQILILLTPIFNNYLILPIQFLYLVCFYGIFLFLYLVANRRIMITGKALLYAAYVASLLALFSLQTEDVAILSIIARAGYFFLIFINFYILAFQVWEFDKCFNIYLRICYIVSILVVIQFILGHIGLGLSLIPPDLTTNTAELMSTNTYRASQVLDNRFSTFFLEPAHQAQYCLPCLSLVLFSGLNTTKKTMIPALVLTAGLLVTTSLQGILGAGTIWLIYLIVMIKEENIKGFWRLLVLIPLIVIAVYFLWSQPILQEQVQKKIASFNRGNIYRGTSLYVRMIYGWDCYKELGFLHKLLGYGYSNSGSYLLSSGIGLRFTSLEMIGYMSGISKMFCEIGLVGVILNFRITVFPLLKRYGENRDLRIIGLLVTVALIMFTSASFDNMSSLLPLTFALSIWWRSKKKYRKK